jgi:hypothetical protein
LIVDAKGKLNLAQLIPPGAEPQAKEPQPAVDAPPPRIRIGVLSVSDGRVGIEDRARARPFATALTPIRFTLTEFKTDLDYSNVYNFSAVSLDGEELNWSGEFTVQPLGSSGQFGIRRLKAATIKSYLHDTLPFALTSGEVGLDGRYRVALNPALALDIDLSNIGVRDLAMADRADETKPVITMPEIDVNAAAFSYAQRSIGIKHVTLRGAHIDLRREQDGSLNVLRLFAQARAAEGASEPLSEAQPAAPVTTSNSAIGDSPDNSVWRASVDNIQLADASIAVDDLAVSPAAHFDLQPIALNVSGWSTAADATVKVTTIIGIDKQGNFTADGAVKLAPLSGQVDFKLGDFSLPSLQPYLAGQTQLTLHSGLLQVQGNLGFVSEPEKAAPLKFAGNVRVDNLRATDRTANEDLIKWQRLAIDGIAASRNPDRLTIERVVARQPYARVAIAADQTVNVSRALSAPGTVSPLPATAVPAKKAAPQPTSAAKPMPIRIKRVQVIDGSANFADYSIEPSFATGILDLNGTVTGLSSDPASRAQVKLEGKVDRYAPVDISGEMNVLAATKYSDIALNFANMELTTFNPYSGKFAGYNISRGKLSTQLRYRVEDRMLDAQHHIVVDNLEFGAKTDSKDAAPIPLKLAIALLKDRNGVIDIELPISGTLDDPEFRLAPIIWKALVGLLKKIAMAPFAAIGALFGGGDELAFVEFDPGSATLAAAENEKLIKVAQGLVARPELKLNIPLTTLDARDNDALAQQAFAALLPPALATSPDEPATRKQRLTILEASLKKSTGVSAVAYPPLDPALPAPTPDELLDSKLDYLKKELLKTLQPNASTLDALARQRASAVQAALLANRELDPQRVFLTSEPAKNTSAGRAVRMEMQLE